MGPERMSPGFWARLAGLTVATLMMLAPACSGGDSQPDPAHIGAGGSGGGGGVASGTCSNEGETRECHYQIGQHDGVLSCWVGQQECRGGMWSPCAGNGTLSAHPALGAQSSNGGSPSLSPQAMTDAGPVDGSSEAAALCNS